MGAAKACCFVILMTLAVFVFWSCGLVLSIYEIIVGAYAFEEARRNANVSTNSFGRCSWKQSDDNVDLIPLYLVVNGIIWLIWSACSALMRCDGSERSTGFYVGSGDLKVHCMTMGESKTRHIVRKFVANIFMVCAVAWVVAGSIFVFLGKDYSSCSGSTYDSARITIIIRWVWVAFIVLVSLALKVMQCALNSRRHDSATADNNEKGKAVL